MLLRRLARVAPLAFLAISILATAAACGDDASGDDPSTIVSKVVRFRTGGAALPAFLDVPFPSDAYLADGKVTSSLALERTFPSNGKLVAEQLGRLNGFSRIAPALFAVDDYAKPASDNGDPKGADVDVTTLPADEKACVADGSSVFLLDLEATDPAKARIACRATVSDERDLDSGRFLVGVGPARGIVLEEGHRYVAVLTSRVKAEGGATIGRSAELDDLLTRRPSSGLAPLYTAAYDAVVALLGPALATDRATIIGLAPYTTQNVTRELYAAREALESAPPPVLSWDPAVVAPMVPARFAAKSAAPLPAGFTATLDDWLGVVAADKKLPDGTDDPDESLPVRAHDKIAAVGTAVFTATTYLRSRPGKYDDLDHGTFAKDGAGNFVAEAPTKIWITFAVPTAPMPPSGYPTVIVQHGLGGSRQYLLSLANRIAAKGFIAVAIDSVTFGARANDPVYRVDTTSDFADAPGATYQGPDGISDVVRGGRAGAFDLFGSLKNLGALRDQLRQAELDTAQVVRLLRSNPDLAPLTTGAVAPKVDPERIAYVGDSLGAIEGAVAAAIEPRVKAWTLNVGGGGIITEIGAHGPAINANLVLAASLNFGIVGAPITEAHPLVVLAQSIVEAGDPIAYAKRLVIDPAPLAGAPTPPRNVFQIEVVYDELVANEGNESLARAAGYALASPNVGPNAGMADLAARMPYRGGGIDLPILPAAPEGYHDVPKPGVTAILVQTSPAVHGHDLVRSRANRSYRIPYNAPSGRIDPALQDARPVPCPYRELQDTMLRFFGDAFEGRVPVVVGFPAPTRDADGDGQPDETDPNPLGP